MEIEDNRECAEEFKAQGNASFKKKDYMSAISSYNKAICKFILIFHFAFLPDRVVDWPC